MAVDLPGPDPKALWREQDQEADPVTLDQIHTMVRRYDRRTRRAVIVIPIILMAVAFVGGVAWIRARDLTGHVFAIAFVLGEAATFLIAWRMLHLARDAAEPAGAYLHRRLKRRLRYLKGGWLLAAAPLVPPLVMATYLALAHGRGPFLMRAAPALLMVVWVALMLTRVQRSIRKTKIQLDELEGLMRR